MQHDTGLNHDFVQTFGDYWYLDNHIPQHKPKRFHFCLEFFATWTADRNWNWNGQAWFTVGATDFGSDVYSDATRDAPTHEAFS